MFALAVALLSGACSSSSQTARLTTTTALDPSITRCSTFTQQHYPHAEMGSGYVPLGTNCIVAVRQSCPHGKAAQMRLMFRIEADGSYKLLDRQPPLCADLPTTTAEPSKMHVVGLAAHMRGFEQLLPAGARRVHRIAGADDVQDSFVTSPLSRSILTAIAMRAATLPGALDRGHFQTVTQIMVSFEGDRLCSGRYDIKMEYGDPPQPSSPVVLGYCTPPCRPGQRHSGCLISSDIGFGSSD